MVELIKSFTFTIDFFDWLLTEGINRKILAERLENSVYERVEEYYIRNIRVFSFGGRLDVNRIREFYTESVLEDKDLLLCFRSDLDRVEKKITSETITEQHYTVFSQTIYKGQVCGSWWEIYELPELIRSLEGSERVRARIAAV